MAASDKTTINSTYNQSGSGLFLDNTTREISPADLRSYVGVMNESVPNVIDNAYDGLKGLKPGISTIAGLKAISTVSQSLNIFVSFRDTGSNNVLRTYELVAGAGTSPADDEASPKQIKPTDYNASTNARLWKLCANNVLISWDLSSNAYLSGYGIGTIYYGTESSGRTTLTDTTGALLPTKVMAIQISETIATNADLVYFYPIY